MITIRFRATKRGKWQTRTFELNVEAEQFCKALPEATETVWEGSAERPDPAPTRAMWTGSVSFGMVNVPVKLYSATEDPTTELHQLCREHHSPLRYKRWCDHGHELTAADTIKGAKVAGAYVPLEASDLDALPKATPKTVAISEFVPAISIPAIHRDRPYFVGPDKTGRHAYDLLVLSLRRTGTIAVCSIVIRDREHLAALEPDGDSLILWTLRRSAEIRSNARLPHLEGETQVSPAELDMACELIKAQTVTMFEPSTHPDRYAAALGQLVERKLTSATPEAPAPNVVDLMSSLKGSVERARKARKAS